MYDIYIYIYVYRERERERMIMIMMCTCNVRRATLPKARFAAFDVRSGWAPLLEFLEVSLACLSSREASPPGKEGGGKGQGQGRGIGEERRGGRTPPAPAPVCELLRHDYFQIIICAC